MTLTRLGDAAGTTALLLESPEPISFIHDVTLALTKRTWHYVPPHYVPPGRGELLDALTAPPPPAPEPQPSQPAPHVTVVRPPLGNAGATIGGNGTGGATGGGWEPGHWVEVDVPVACTLLADGDESDVLVVPEAPLAAGTYVLALIMDRTRWRASTSEPEATYHDEATIQLSW